MCHNFKSIKAVKENVDQSLLKIFPKFFGKVTREKQVRGKKKQLSVTLIRFLFIQVPPYVYVSKQVALIM